MLVSFYAAFYKVHTSQLSRVTYPLAEQGIEDSAFAGTLCISKVLNGRVQVSECRMSETVSP